MSYLPTDYDNVVRFELRRKIFREECRSAHKYGRGWLKGGEGNDQIPARKLRVDSKERWKGAKDGKAKESRAAIKQPLLAFLFLPFHPRSPGWELKKPSEGLKLVRLGPGVAWLSRNMRGLSLFKEEICRFNAPVEFLLIKPLTWRGS